MCKFIRVVWISILAAVFLSGCSVPFINSGEKPSAAAASDSQNTTKKETGTVTGEEDERIKSLINDYFSCLYAEPAISYYPCCTTGTLPAKIKDFISPSTVSLAEGNPEIGIHMPRFVEINGLTAIGYEIVKNKGVGDKELPDIEAGFAGNSGDSSFYFVKVGLYAKCVNSSTLEMLYTLNTQNNIWQKKDTQAVDENLTDTIRVQVKYDVEVRKEDGNYKLVSVKEANTRTGLKNRLYIYNNDFMTRLPYLNSMKTADGKAYVNEDDGKTYEEEKAVIQSFFDSLKKSLNKENMKLLYPMWNTGTADFKGFLDKIAQPGEGDAKKLSDLMEIRDDYRTKFGYESFPLQVNMERLEGEYKSFEVVPHPGYTKKQKRYAVAFKVPVKKANGLIEGEEDVYGYDYFVTLAKANEVLKVSGIKLNECSRVEVETETKADAKTKAETTKPKAEAEVQ